MGRSKKISLLISAILGLNSILNRPPAYFIYLSLFFNRNFNTIDHHRTVFVNTANGHLVSLEDEQVLVP